MNLWYRLFQRPQPLSSEGQRPDGHRLTRFNQGLQRSLANSMVRGLSPTAQTHYLDRCLKLETAQPLAQTQVTEFTLAESLKRNKQIVIDALISPPPQASDSSAQPGRFKGWSWPV
jgi:hypothetical protein